MSKIKNYQIGIISLLLLAGCSGRDGVVQMQDDKSALATELGYMKGVYEYRSGSAANEMIRIVQVNGRKVPGQFGVAEGANLVSISPGEHDVKVLWAHGRGEIDLYTYSTFRIHILPNCMYQFYSKIAAAKKEVYIDVFAAAVSKTGNQQCGKGIVQRFEQQA